MLGFGDFYYELGVQIVEACLATRQLNGGLMDMRSLLRFVMVLQPARRACLASCTGASNEACMRGVPSCMHEHLTGHGHMGTLQRRRGSRADPVTEDDVLRAIDRLKVLGGGFDILTVCACAGAASL